jgi:hypothetical protein
MTERCEPYTASAGHTRLMISAPLSRPITAISYWFVLALQIEPEWRAVAETAAEPHRRIGCDRTPGIENIGDAPRGHAEIERQTVGAELAGDQLAFQKRPGWIAGGMSSPLVMSNNPEIEAHRHRKAKRHNPCYRYIRPTVLLVPLFQISKQVLDLVFSESFSGGLVPAYFRRMDSAIRQPHAGDSLALAPAAALNDRRLHSYRWRHNPARRSLRGQGRIRQRRSAARLSPGLRHFGGYFGPQSRYRPPIGPISCQRLLFVVFEQVCPPCNSISSRSGYSDPTGFRESVRVHPPSGQV